MDAAPLKLAIVPVTPFQQNCSVIFDEESKRAAVVDPGGNVDHIEEAIRALGVKVEKILLTHAHIDHAGGTAELARSLQLPIEGPHRGDQFWIDQMPEQARTIGSSAVTMPLAGTWTTVRPSGPRLWM